MNTLTGGACERVPAPLAVLGDVVDEDQVLVHRPGAPPQLVILVLLLLLHRRRLRRG